ncbi:unnamed protein product, partial [Mesorhabditis spiculigera]
MNSSAIVSITLFGCSCLLLIFYSLSMQTVRPGCAFSVLQNFTARLPYFPSETFEQRQQRLNDVHAVIEQNSDPLPKRTSNLTASEFCSIKGNCIRPVAKYDTRWKVSNKFKLAACLIHKTMSSVMTGIMCFLEKARSYKQVNATVTSYEQAKTICHGNHITDFAQMEEKYNLVGWDFVVLTRHPIDRFLSGYVDRCIRMAGPVRGEDYCNGCGMNMTCFLETEYQKIQRQIQNKRISRGFVDRHFYPQSWRCQILDNADRYKFIKYTSDPAENVLPELENVFTKHKVPKSYIDFVRSQLTSLRTVHATIATPSRQFLEERLLSSDYLLELVVRIFYHDFRILNYQLPF